MGSCTKSTGAECYRESFARPRLRIPAGGQLAAVVFVHPETKIMVTKTANGSSAGGKYRVELKSWHSCVVYVRRGIAKCPGGRRR